MDPALPHTFDTSTGTLIQTLLLCDLVGSTRLVESVGDERAAEIFRRHDEFARRLLEEYEGFEVDKTDGFLLLFARPIQAVAFALTYHRTLKVLSSELDVDLAARVGIHLGEVVVRANEPAAVARGAKPVDVDGLAKPMAARLMSLAGARQTLLSRGAYELASRASVGVAGLPANLQWVAHGHYRFHGVEAPARVYEVGCPGVAPLRPPARTAKARPVGSAWYRRPRMLAVAAMLIMVAVTGWVMVGRSSATLDFEARDWIVLGNFENVTGDVLLDDSLEEAFRVGLEQSRYANVLPNSQVRRALRHLELDVRTPIDREIGSQIAIREGASALVLGEVADVGRAFSLKAEILHPSSGRSIYTETALASDRDGILRALEEVIVGVRSHLGESLAAIEGSSVSLEKVTTADLEALKAYSLGINQIASGQHEPAIQLLERAVGQDAGFAMAHAKLGTTYNNFRAGDPRAMGHWQTALDSSDRLTEREQLYIEGCLANRGAPEGMRKVWYLMSTLYPDQAVGHHNLGNNHWYYQNDFQQAAVSYERATTLKHPWMFSTHHHLGYMRLALGRPRLALESFETAWALEPNPLHSGMADALVVLKRYDEASAFLERGLASPTSHFIELETRMRQVGLLADRGQLERALAVADEALARARTLAIHGADGRALAAVLAVLERTAQSERFADELGQAIDSLDALLDTDVDQLDHVPVGRLGLLGKISARNGETDRAERVLARIAPRAEGSGFRFWQAYAEILQAELDLADGRVNDAIARLEACVGASELFQAHESLARAYEAAGRIDQALVAHRWLADHRGQAFSEWLAGFFGQAFNILDATTAEYHLGRLHAQRGEHELARAAYGAFLDHWQHGDSDLPLIVETRRALASMARAERGGG